MDATRSLKAKVAKNVFTLTKVADFSNISRSSHRSSFLLITLENLQYSAKTDYFWVAVGATRCLKAKIAENVFTLKFLLVFLLFCDRLIKVSSFWPPSKVCNIRQKMLIFVWELMEVDAWRLKVHKFFQLDELWCFLQYFLMDSSKLVLFSHPEKIATFGKIWLFLGRNGRG